MTVAGGEGGTGYEGEYILGARAQEPSRALPIQACLGYSRKVFLFDISLATISAKKGSHTGLPLQY